MSDAGDTAATVLEARDLWRAYPRGADAAVLRGADLCVRRGETVSVVGASGSGKSTLLNLLGLLDRPDRGRYLVDREDVTACRGGRRALIRASRIGFVFQQFHLLPHATALANVEVGMSYAGFPRAVRSRLAAQALERVGLLTKSAQRARTLSGGEQQRVAVARAIARRPAILLCDEPTGNLDADNSLQLLDLLQREADGGCALVVITHDAAVASRMSRTLKIVDGRLIPEPAA